MTQIKFGTDGWRGIIADDFTFDNVRRVAGAIATYILKHEDAHRGVVIGYDTRFASDRAAEHFATAHEPERSANALIRAAQSVKLLGAQVVLTGIRPEVAQTLSRWPACPFVVLVDDPVRARLQADERWQGFLARIQPLIHTQQNRILVPTSFSPIR